MINAECTVHFIYVCFSCSLLPDWFYKVYRDGFNHLIWEVIYIIYRKRIRYKGTSCRLPNTRCVCVHIYNIDIYKTHIYAMSVCEICDTVLYIK